MVPPGVPQRPPSGAYSAATPANRAPVPTIVGYAQSRANIGNPPIGGHNSQPLSGNTFSQTAADYADCMCSSPFHSICVLT